MIGLFALGVAALALLASYGGIRWVHSPWYRGRTRAKWAWPKAKLTWFIVGFVAGFAVASSVFGAW